MKKRDCRTVAEVLKHQRWGPMIAALDMDAVTAPQIRILDAFMEFIENKKISSILDLGVSDFLSFNAECSSANRLRTLKNAMQVVFPAQPALLVLTNAIRLKEAQVRPPAAKEPKQRTLQVSIPENELPKLWKQALADMNAGFDGNGVIAPSRNMIMTYKMKLRQLACSARMAGITEEFSVDAIKAYARDMRGRGLAAATELASFSALKKCACYVGADFETLELLSELTRRAESRTRKEPKKKYEKLQKTGYSPVAIVDQADELLKEAKVLVCPRARQVRRNTAAALALFSVLPIRLADTRLNFGENLTWCDGRYEMHVTLSKDGETYDAEIDTRLNRFIDALILRGSDEVWLDQMRVDCLTNNRPLFIRNDGEGVGYNYVSDCWRAKFGTGEHIARTILHTFLGIELGVAGTDMALAANGQKSEQTAASYQDDAVAKAKRKLGQKSLTYLVDKRHLALFEFK